MAKKGKDYVGNLTGVIATVKNVTEDDVTFQYTDFASLEKEFNEKDAKELFNQVDSLSKSDFERYYS